MSAIHGFKKFFFKKAMPVIAILLFLFYYFIHTYCCTIDKIVHWHNVIKPHMSLDYDEPCNVFWYRLPPERILAYAQKWLYV